MEWKECVQKMIDYIEINLKENIALTDVALHVGYSQFYCSKSFSREVGICMKNYIRLRKMSAAALELRDTKKRILDIAFEYGYNSQEAFTRSFTETFDVNPGAYRRLLMPLPLFLHRHINHQHIKGDDLIMNEKFMQNVSITFVRKPARKMLVWHVEGATNYHELCDAKDAEKVWGLLESMSGTLDGVIAAWLNKNGESRYVWGVEMPLNYNGVIPEGLESVDAPECDYVKFCHPPYAEEVHEPVTEAVWNISEAWSPKENGWEWNDSDNPVYEDDRVSEGYMVLKPIRKA